MTTPAGRPEAPALDEAFRVKAETTGAAVRVAADEAAAADLVAAAAPGAARTASLVARFPGAAARFAPLPDAAGSRDGARLAADVVAAGAWGIAETGSVVLREATAADRGACWLADRLWLLLPAGQLEPTLDAGLARVARLVREGASYVTLVSGPSRTADIERVLTIGVHGPREVTVVLVGDGRGS